METDPSGLPIRTAWYCETCGRYFDSPTVCIPSGTEAVEVRVATHDTFPHEHTHDPRKPA